QRELDVHVELEVAGEKEGEIRPGPRPFYGLLFRVVQVFRKARRPQDVFSHALAPLSAALGNCEGFLPPTGWPKEQVSLFPRHLKMSRQLAELLRPVFFEVFHEPAYVVE